MSLKWMLAGLLAVAMGLCASHARAAGDEIPADVREFVASLKFRGGEIPIPGADARFRFDDQFRYLGQADAQRVLEQLWGNPPDQSVLGLVVPRGRGLLDDNGWAVVVTYSDEGYVSDEDAAAIDYDELLAGMKEETQDENAARKEAGYEAIELIGWATPPRYDAASNKRYWAKELAFDGSQRHTLNYDIRVLGRRGYLSLNAVANMDDLADVQAGMQKLLPLTDFDSGARYADFDGSTDKIAAYGIAALIGGGIAAKAGLFAKLGALLLGLKKLLIPLVLVLAAFGRKVAGLFRRNGSGDGTVA
jgi:uncharacterized membrane-anchored protein